MANRFDDWQDIFRLKKTLVTLFLVLVLIAGASYRCLGALYLFIETDQGRTIPVPARQGDTFSLKYTHSVQKTPVAENFVIVAAGHLLLDSTVYQSYGVGLPALAGEGRFERRGDTFVLTGLERRFEKVVIHAGPEARHTIEYRGQTIPLHALHEGGATVTIRTGPYYSRWLRDN